MEPDTLHQWSRIHGATLMMERVKKMYDMYEERGELDEFRGWLIQELSYQWNERKKLGVEPSAIMRARYGPTV